MFISTTISTLICAYLQEINTLVVFLGLFLGGVYGALKAEKIRTTSGLISHQKQVDKFQQHY
jgi:hypothetical protein